MQIGDFVGLSLASYRRWMDGGTAAFPVLELGFQDEDGEWALSVLGGRAGARRR